MRWLAPIILAGALAWACLGWWAFGETIQNDAGGSVSDRVEAMRHTSGVRIAGRCHSACTMYLGLPATCVAETARMGFHSPSTRSGLPLPRAEWERVTRLMADQYPPALRRWYMGVARHSTDLRVLSGREVIRLGARACPE